MATIKLKHKYELSYDQENKGYEATLEYQSVADSYIFNSGRGSEIILDMNELNALMSMVTELKETHQRGI
jgi:hypothetical protein